jgi:hypothetical protein
MADEAVDASAKEFKPQTIKLFSIMQGLHIFDKFKEKSRES